MYRIFFLFALLVLYINSYSQEKTDANIFGHVICCDEHIPGVHIMVEGTRRGAITDATGHFRILNLVPGKYTLRASALGYKTASVEVVVELGKLTEVDIELEQDVMVTGEVVVSSNREEVNRRESPIVINVLSPKVFSQTSSVCLSDGLNFQPGLRVENNCQNCGFQQVRINGLEGPYSQILINSRPVFSSLSSVYGIEMLPVDMIERVEIIRGGNSSYFGSNAIAGTINIITKEPTRNSYSARSSLSVINQDSYDATAGFNSTVVNENLLSGFSIFGSVRDRKPYDHNNDGFSEIGMIKNNTLGLRSFYKPSINNKINIEYYNISESRRGGNNFDLQPHETDITEMAQHDIHGFGADFQQFSKDRNTSILTYYALQSTNRNTYYGTEMDPDAYGKSKDLTYSLGIQINHSYDSLFKVPSKLSTGLDFNSSKLCDRIISYDREINQHTMVPGYYFQNEWTLSQFKLLIGGRLDKHNLIDNVIFSPRINLMYNYKPDLQFRLGYSQGYRAPQTFEEDLHVAAVGGEAMLISNSNNLREEKSHSLSLASEYNYKLGKNNFVFIADVFYNRLDNVFVLEAVGTDASNNILVERRNGDAANVYGINLEGRFFYSRFFELQTGFTTQKSMYADEEEWSEDPNAETSRRMFRTPDNYGYIMGVLNIKNFNTISVNTVYTGSMLVPHFSGYIDNDVLKVTPDFWDVSIKYTRKFYFNHSIELEMSAGVQNVLNQYQKDFDKGINRDAGYIYGPGKPRTYFFSLKFSKL